MEKPARSFSKGSRYGHATGRIMVHEARLLTAQQVHRMIESDYTEALGVSSETVYGPYLEGASTPEKIEEGLAWFLADEYLFMDQVARGTQVSEFMHLKYDFHNLRVALKERYFPEVEGDRMISDLGTVDVEALRGAVAGDSRASAPAYALEVTDSVATRFAEQVADPQVIDTVVDRAFLERRLAVAKGIGSGLLVDFSRASIDVANVGILLRGRNLTKDQGYYEDALADGGRLPRSRLLKMAGEPSQVVLSALPGTRYGRLLAEALEGGDERARLSSLDKAADEVLLEQLARFSRVSVGPERVVRYMITRENEVAILRVIFIGKLAGLNPEMIESRLPQTYVQKAVR